MRDFARVKRGDARPADCVRCHRTEDLLDLGAETVDGYGVVYFCTMCFAILANQLGLIDGETHRMTIEAKDAEIAALNARLNDPVPPMSLADIHPTRLKEMKNGLVALVDDFATGVLSDSRDRLSAVVSAHPAGDAGSSGAAGGVSEQNPGDPGDIGGELPRVGGASDGAGGEAGAGLPGETAHPDGDPVGDEPAADDQDDRPDGDESDDWFANLELADDGDAPLDPDDARD